MQKYWHSVQIFQKMYQKYSASFRKTIDKKATRVKFELYYSQREKSPHYFLFSSRIFKFQSLTSKIDSEIVPECFVSFSRNSSITLENVFVNEPVVEKNTRSRLIISLQKIVTSETYYKRSSSKIHFRDIKIEIKVKVQGSSLNGFKTIQDINIE